MALLGSVGLIGLAINDSIVVLDRLAGDPAARRGDRAAICQIVLGETRHVLSTTLTTIGSFAPLILIGGTFWPPLGVAVCGGLVVATGLALILVPCLFQLSSAGAACAARPRSNPVTGNGSFPSRGLGWELGTARPAAGRCPPAAGR